MPVAKSNGIDIYFEEKGSGEPLFLIMGITAPGDVWEKHLDHWQKFYRCIIMDNRGVGKSEKPPGPYTSQEMAMDCIGVMDHLGISSTKVVGVSMGSIIAQQMAILFPERIRSLVLMCPWARCDNMAKLIFRHIKNCKARFRPEEFSSYIQLLIFSKSTLDNETSFRELLEDQKKAGLNPNPQPLVGLEGQADACMSHSALEDLGTIKCPTLVIGGKEDIFTPVWMAREVAHAIPGSEIYIYENGGHAFHWENLEDFNTRVVKWLENNPL